MSDAIALEHMKLHTCHIICSSVPPYLYTVHKMVEIYWPQS